MELRVGAAVDDLCRACKLVRRHTVTATGADVVRVLCDYCGSQHRYRGGGPVARAGSAPSAAVSRGAFPLVSPRETSEVAMSHDESASGTGAELERLLRRVIREETGLTPVVPAAKWLDGQLVLRPGREGVQEKTWPIETFFHKIVMLRNRLRSLEQQVNAADLPVDLKLKLQSYITGCYGSLTSFNVLFADEADRFHGSGE